MWEPVAGVIDPGETAEETAIREAEEEAGVAVLRLEPVAQVYPSSGALAEFIHVFIGIADLSDINGGGVVLLARAKTSAARTLSYDELMTGRGRADLSGYAAGHCSAVAGTPSRDRLRHKGY